MKRMISRAYRQLNNGNLMTFGGHVGASLKGNVHFPTPTPTLTVFDAVLLDYGNAVINFKKGDNESAALREEARRILIENLDLLANYVELTAEFKETILVTSGFNLKKEKPTRRPIPSTPAIIAIADGVKSGQVKLKVDVVGYANNFSALYKVTGSDEQPKYELGKTKRTIVIDGLTPGQYYSFQVSAANSAGESGWSASQSFLVR